jgi:fatty-acyl-CoA synthase
MIGVLACVSRGSAIVLSGETFEPSEVLRTVADEQCTALYGVPAMFIQELTLDGFDLSSLRTGVMGGAPCPIEVMRKVQEQMNMREVVVVYGMTETAITTMTRPGDSIERQIGTVGRALPFTEIKLIGPDGAVAPRGEPGEVCARGYSNMLGYWGDEEATRNALDSAGWMHTGDLATMDAEGYLKIVGRIKDMIVRGGENIFPAEVEQFLYTHPAIDEVQVIGVPSHRYGEEVAAFVRTRESASVSESELRSFCEGQIATHKIPAYWRFVDQYPMTTSGKVLKYKLREQAITELGLQDVAHIETA